MTRALALVALFGSVLLLGRSRSSWRSHAQELTRELEVVAVTRAERVEPATSEEASALAQQLAVAQHAEFLEQLALASRALDENRLVECARRLDAVPEEHLGWEWSHLEMRLGLAVLVALVEESPISALAASRDGALLATGTRDGELRVWSTAHLDFEEPLFEASLDDELRALDVDGVRVVCATVEGALVLFEHESGEQVFSEMPPSAALSLALLADGRLVAGFEGGEVGLRAADGTWSYLAAHDDDVGAVEVSPDGLWIASAADDGLVQLHGGASFGENRGLELHTDWVRALAFDADSERLASGGDDGKIAIWSLVSAERLQLLEPGVGAIQRLEYLGGGLSFLGDEAHGRVTQGLDVTDLEFDIEAWEGFESVAFARDGQSFAGVTRGEELLLWSFEPPRTSARIGLSKSAIRALVQSADGAWIAAGTLAGEVFLLDGASGELAHEWKLESSVLSLAFGANSDLLAAGTRDGELVTWVVEGGERSTSLSEPRSIASLSLSASAERALCVSWDGGASLLELASGAVISRAEPPRALVMSAAAAPDASRFAWVGDAGTVRVWDAESGERRAALRDRQLGRPEDLSFSADAKLLAAIASGNELTIFDLDAQTVLARGRDDSQGLSVLAFDSSGERLLTGGMRGHVTIWDAASATPLLELEGDGHGLSSAAFSPDGARVLAGTTRGALVIWETDADALEELIQR